MATLAPARARVEQQHADVSARAATAASPMRWVVLSVLATFVAVNLLVLLAEPYVLYIARFDQQHTVAHIVDYQRAPRPDVIFMGTSRALSGFDPSVAEREIESLTGQKIYAHNLSFTGGTIDIHYLILKNIIRTDKQPKVIVYGLTDSEFRDTPNTAVDYLPYTNLLLRPDDFLKYSGTTLDSKIEFWANQAFPLYRDRRVITNALSIALNPYDPAYHYYRGPDRRDPAANGFLPGSGNAKAPPAQMDQNRNEYANILPNYRVGYQRLETLHQFLRLADQRGIKVILVNMPVNTEMQAMWGSPDMMARYRAMFQVIAADHGVSILDIYQGFEGLPADAFWDWHHLNEVGAGAVTRLVTDTYLAPAFGGTATAPAPAAVALPQATAPALTGQPAVVAAPPITIQALYPPAIVQGEGFNVQPDGSSAIAIKVDNPTNTSVIVFAGTRLETVQNPNGILTAKVPPALFAAPGSYPVVISDGRSESNTFNFVVSGK